MMARDTGIRLATLPILGLVVILAGITAVSTIRTRVRGDATPEEHHLAYSLNLSCLWRVGGCKGAESLLPAAVPLAKKELLQ